MTKIIRLVAAAAVSIAASLPALAEETKAATEAQPIPTLHCEFKSVNACSTDGTCKAGSDLAGMPLPLKVTVDFENTVVSAIDDTGYARTDNTMRWSNPAASSWFTASIAPSAGRS